jgi:hypothetical protein
VLARGVPLKLVSEVLGPSSIYITKDVCGYLVWGAKRDMAERTRGSAGPRVHPGETQIMARYASERVTLGPDDQSNTACQQAELTHWPRERSASRRRGGPQGIVPQHPSRRTIPSGMAGNLLVLGRRHCRATRRMVVSWWGLRGTTHEGALGCVRAVD